LAGFVGNLAAVNPSILDKVDMDEAIDQYGMMLGVPPKVVRSDEDVDKIRADKAAQMQQQQNIANATQMAQGAKVLADTKTGEGSALDMILGAQ
jgi:hypothetical protein